MFIASFKKNLKGCLLCSVATAALAFFIIQPISAEPLDINAQSCILIDSRTGQVLYEQNAHERLYPASTTKIMTAILALEKGDLSQMMAASQEAVYDIGKDGMNIGLTAGEEIRMEDLLNVMLIRSANETANIIAENICPTRSEFVELMNRRAQELGAVDTNFVNPCGKDSEKEDANHLSTAADMAKLARHAMTLPKLREIVQKESFKMPASNKHPETFWPLYSTTNKLLLYEKYKSSLFKVIGIKTGYTDKAGNNLISAAVNQDGMELIAVVMGVKNAPADSVFQYSKTLFEYGFNNFALQKFTEANQAVKSVSVEHAADHATLDLVTSQALSSVLPVDKNTWNITNKEYINPQISAPVHAGDVLGYVEYERNGVPIGRADIVASMSIEKSFKAKFLEKAKNISSNPLFIKSAAGIFLVVCSFIALRFTLRKISRAVNARRHQGT